MSELREMPILSLLPAKRFHSCVLTTYSFDFNYFNHDALAGLSRAGVRNICIFLDDAMLQQYLGNISGYAAAAVKRYSVSSIVRQGAFHPKLSLFFGREGHGFFIIGSGNLTAAGHGSNHELWGAFHIDGPNDPKAPLFKQAWEYLKVLGTETPGISMRKLEWIETHTPWLHDIKIVTQTSGLNIGSGVEAFLLSNSDKGIFTTLQSIVKGKVLECTAVSPFFDNKAAMLFELERLYPDASIHVIVQPDTCTGDLPGKKFNRVQFYDWNSIINEKRRRYLHAKLLHIRTDTSEYCLFGSANLTTAALGTSSNLPTNEEVCLLLKRKSDSWLGEIGLSSKGDIISVKEITNAQEDDTEKKSPVKYSFRLKSIDRIANHLHVYMEQIPDIQNALLVLFDGWGEEQVRIEMNVAEFKKDDGNYTIFTDNVPDAVLFGQLFDNTGIAISNKQIIQDISALSRTNPDPNTQRLEEVLGRIEFADAEMIEILRYLDPEDLTDERIARTAKNETEDKIEKARTDGTGEFLSYDEFTKISPEYKYSGGISYLYGTHRIERILETLRTIFEKLKIRDIDIAGQDEEADKESLESSAGRNDEEPPAKRIPPQTPSAFASLHKTVFRFFNQYISILEKQRHKKHKVNVLDASMFVIALHLLLDFLNKPIRVKKIAEDEEYNEILLKTDGEYFEKKDYCRIVADIIGKFTLLIINGVDDANDEYVRRRIEKCRKMAYWHAICCIARLVPSVSKEDGFIDYSPIWKWELGMNLRHFYSPADLDEMQAIEEIAQRVQIMNDKDKMRLKSLCLNEVNCIEKEYRHYRERNPHQKALFEKGKKIFCPAAGFSHLFRVIPPGKYHEITIARVGYPVSKSDIWDFEENKKFAGEYAHIETL